MKRKLKTLIHSKKPQSLVFPEEPARLSKPERLEGESWDWENALHGEVMDPGRRPGRVKSALRKNTNLGRRTVFFVTG